MSQEHNVGMEAAGAAIPVQPAAAAAAGLKAVEWGGTAAREAEEPLVPVYHVRRGKARSRIHLFSFAASVLLTVLAFGAALYGEMSADLLVPFLMLMAAIQLVIQLVYWMHMKNQSDLYSVLSLAFGSIITLIAMGAAVYWVWV